MIKIILIALFKSSAAMKVFFIGVLEAIGRGFDNLSYHIIHPIRLIRFQDVRESLADNYLLVIFCIILILVAAFLIYNKNQLRGDNTS
tara:strand:- start:355 stop:618 length:264 start_codon:yes stop_codon:yes gene_type:complete